MTSSNAPQGFDYLTFIALLALASTIFLTWLTTRYAPRLAAPFLPDTSRIGSLDGLRGLLAVSVVVHHAINTVVSDKTGYIGPLAVNFQNQLGSCAVALFFMLSAYLFCGKLLKNGGKITASEFFENRVMRITPIYYFCVSIIIVISICQQNWSLKVTYLQFIEDIVRTGSFRFLPVISMNGTWFAHLIAQSWTLRYEWVLYLFLPLLGFCLRKYKSQFSVIIPLIILSFFDSRFAFFATGTIAVRLSDVRDGLLFRAYKPLGAVGIILVMLFQNSSTGWTAAVLLTPFFVAVAQSQGVARIFAARPLRLLGEISFSLYMIHNITGFLFRSLTIENWAQLGPSMLYAVIMGWTLIAILGSLLTFRFIEQPMMKMRPYTVFRNHWNGRAAGN